MPKIELVVGVVVGVVVGPLGGTSVWARASGAEGTEGTAGWEGRVNAAAPWYAWDRATGDWGGSRSRLESRGLFINAEYTFEWSSVWDGGVNNRASTRNLFTLDALLDLEVATGLDGASVFVQYLSVNPERGGSRDAGDIQVYSNLENDRHIDAIYELWYEQELFDERLRVKAGKFDANSEFAYVDAAGDFSNSSAGYSPTIVGLATYPDSATGIAVFGRVIEHERAALELSYGFFDGAAEVDGVRTGTRGPATFFSDDKSDDYLHIGQATLWWGRLGALHDGRLSCGVAHHTGDFARFDGETESGSTSFYATIEQRFWRPDAGRSADEDDSGRGVYGFAQYGWADDDVSEFHQHIAAGIVGRGLIGSRAADAAGVYVSYADLSDAAGAGFEEDEWVIDAYYRVQATGFFYVQPEIQYIINPSGDPAIDDALVGGVRLGIVF